MRAMTPRGTIRRQIRSLVAVVAAVRQLQPHGIHAGRAQFLQIPDGLLMVLEPRASTDGSHTSAFLRIHHRAAGADRGSQ